MYELKIFLKGAAGFYAYSVPDMDQAMDHFAKIVSNGYRRVNSRGQLVQIMPSEISEVRVVGHGLNTQYPDTFVRT